MVTITKMTIILRDNPTPGWREEDEEEEDM
jgi:hypothetical protein